MQSNGGTLLLPSINSVLNNNKVNNNMDELTLNPILIPYNTFNNIHDNSLLLNNLNNINNLNALNNINNLNININNNNINLNNNNNNQILNISLPVCKTTSKCKTKVKLINGKICIKRKTIFKTIMEMNNQLNNQSRDQCGREIDRDNQNDRHITSICLQYYEVPFPDGFNIKSMENFEF